MGDFEGFMVGFCEGFGVVGPRDGDLVGVVVGFRVGAFVGFPVVGLAVVGFLVGLVGFLVGLLVGIVTGELEVGDEVGIVGDPVVGLSVIASNKDPFSEYLVAMRHTICELHCALIFNVNSFCISGEAFAQTP